MKKQILPTLILIIITYSNSIAQSIEQGNKRTDWGFHHYYQKTNFYGFNTEKCVADNITAGFTLSLTGTFSNLNLILLPGLRGSYYVTELLKLDPEKIDIYGGIGFYKPLNIYTTIPFSGNKELKFDGDYPILLSLHGGGRYFFNDRFGLNGEFRISKKTLGSNFTIGLNISMKK